MNRARGGWGMDGCGHIHDIFDTHAHMKQAYQLGKYSLI